MYKCEKCDKEFKEKYILNRHQRESKKCINSEKKEFMCTFCNKNLSSNQRLETHINICKKKKKEINNTELENIKKEMSILKKSFEKIKAQSYPYNTTNNITINTTDNSTTNIMNNYTPFLQYMTPSVIKETFEQKYTIKDLSGSQKALANFTSKYFLSGKNKPLYLCTDRSRQHFVFPDENRDIEDQNAMILIALISKGFGAVKKLYKKQLTELNRKLKKHQEDDNTAMITDTFAAIKKLEQNYQQVLSTQEEGDNYRAQLSKILPSNVDNRLLIDTTLERLEENSDDDIEEKENEKEKEKEKEKRQIQMPVLHDKTARHIGNITYGKLRLYKNHYLKTGKIIMPEHYNMYEEFKTKYLEFIHSDE